MIIKGNCAGVHVLQWLEQIARFEKRVHLGHAINWPDEMFE